MSDASVYRDGGVVSPLRLGPKESNSRRSVAVCSVADSGVRQNRFLILELRAGSSLPST